MENQVGRPLMLEGKIFFPDTGIPMWNMARRRVVLAVALPEPLTVQTVMQKSFTTFDIICPASDSFFIEAPFKKLFKR
jgi:hypothetical protein